MASKRAFCPFCGSGRIGSTDGGYLEQGEFNGKCYQNEGFVAGYYCGDCGKRFYAWNDLPEEALVEPWVSDVRGRE